MYLGPIYQNSKACNLGLKSIVNNLFVTEITSIHEFAPTHCLLESQDNGLKWS